MTSLGVLKDAKVFPYNLEALAFLSNESVGWDPVIVEENLVRIDSPPSHLLDLSQVQAWCVFIKIDEEERQAFRWLSHFL